MLRNDAQQIAVSTAEQGCYARTSAAVPMMIMNVRSNKANGTIMTEILKMKKIMKTLNKIRSKRPKTYTWPTKGENTAIFILTTNVAKLLFFVLF